jgi:Na+-transporting NADH:ubiquinone oxidoreductase subunit C
VADDTIALGRWRFARESPGYTLAFAAVVCIVCALLVAIAAVSLQPAQEAKQQHYVQKNVLIAAGLLAPGVDISAAELRRVFAERIELRLVDLANGTLVPPEVMDAAGFDPRRARSDPALSQPAPANRAGVMRLPRYALVYVLKQGGALDQLVLAIDGLGMWGTVYGFIALDADATTVRGLTFHEQKETPGLGGEIGNPAWQALWRGRRIFDDKWQPQLTVIKGPAGAPAQDPLRVDGLSGSTVTSNAVTHLVHFWFSPAGYGPLLANLRSGKVQP